MTDFLSAAMRYAELGYPVFPCAPDRKQPLTARGFQDATIDPQLINTWWAKHPRANIAIPTSGLVVIDVDGRENTWLADQPERLIELATSAVAVTPRGGKHYIFRQPAGVEIRCQAGRLAPSVDVRAAGGYILVPPSKIGSNEYQFAPGLELDVPRDKLSLPPAWLVSELQDRAPPSTSVGSTSDANAIPSGQRNATLARRDGAMRRVGMSQNEISAALNRVNGDRCSPPMSPAEVERIASSVARYEPDQISVATVEDHWMQDRQPGIPSPREASAIADPGPLPEDLLRIPGFISEVMDLCLETAPYPNTTFAFCGALSLQAFLAGRKVRDQADNRTNIYLLALGFSSAGKDWPRKLNTLVIHRAGLLTGLGQLMASGEGIQDKLFRTPTMLFQTDEIDGMLQSINKAKDARHESIMNTMLTMYSSANSMFPMRSKAGKDDAGMIDQPCLVVYGTAIPTHYYSALSERMLTNGFLARMIVVECPKRCPGQEPKILLPTDRIVDTANHWGDLGCGWGNLNHEHPDPLTVPYSDPAKQIFIESRVQCELEYSLAEGRADAVGTTVWGRVNEHARKLALIYACSENHNEPCIGAAAAGWATAFMMHQARRMLFMAQSHVADNPFHADCLRLMQKLRDAPENSLTHSVLLKRMKLDTQTLQKIVQTLQQQGDLEVGPSNTSGRPGIVYRLVQTQAAGEIGGERRGEISPKMSEAEAIGVKEGERR